MLTRLSQHAVERGELRAGDADTTELTLVARYKGLALLYFVEPQALPWPQPDRAGRGHTTGL
ncbi:MAG TPA: hypothetical protein VGF67_10105 [Ktedonobacteraceae bacterium]